MLVVQPYLETCLAIQDDCGSFYIASLVLMKIRHSWLISLVFYFYRLASGVHNI